MTEKGDFFVLSFSETNSELVTLIHANVIPPDCQPSRICQLLSIDTNNQFIAIHTTIGIIQLIYFEITGHDISFKKAFPLKVMELELMDMTFVDPVRSSSTSATLAILHQIPMKTPHIKTYEVSKQGNSFSLSALNYSMSDLSYDTNQIVRVPAPRGGFLVLSSDRIIYTNPVTNVIRKVIFTPTYFTAVAHVDNDGFRFIFGSSSGEFFILLILASPTGKVTELKFERLGRTSIASCLTYIDDGYVFVGSQHADSQLIQMTTERVHSEGTEAQFLKIAHTFPSLAPLNDFCLIPSNGMSDQNSIVAGGGSASYGAIKVISNGIEAITIMSAELAILDSEDSSARCSVIPSSIFAFRAGKPEETLNHSHLAISSLGQTEIYAVDPIAGSLEEVSWGLNSTSETLNLLQLESGHLPQVTCTGIYLGYSGNVSCGGMWNCKPNERVILSVNCENYVLIAMSDFWVRLFHVTPAGFSVVASAQFSSEVSCMNIFKSPDGNLIGSISFWDMTTFGFLAFDSKAKTIKLLPIEHPFVKEAVIRSTQLLQSPSGDLYSLFGSGNGKILICPVPKSNPDAVPKVKLDSITILRLGSAPVKIFAFDDKLHLIAQSDRPYYISWLKEKLLCSVINIPTFDSLTQFNFGDQAGFVTIKGREVQFSYIQQSQVPKVNIKSIPVGKSVYKLVHLPQARLFAAILHNFPVLTIPQSHWSLLKSELVLFDEETFQIVDRYDLQTQSNSEKDSLMNIVDSSCTEIGWSLATGTLNGLNSASDSLEPSVIILGTGILKNNDTFKNETGRILVFQIGESNRLRLISSNDVKGGVRVVSICKGNVIGCVRGLNVVYKWDYQVEKKLIKASSSGGHIDGTCIDSLDNILCIGDSLTSVSFCHLNKDTLKISEIARDFQDNYISALKLVNHSSAIAADLTGNLLVYHIIRDGALDLNVAICEGNIHLGDQITKILPGNFRNASSSSKQSFLCISSTGSIYALHQISSELFKTLRQIQKNMVPLIKLVGGIKHADFRKFYNGERSMKSSQGFIDGDLLTRFMSLSMTIKKEILGQAPKSTASEKVGLSVDEITQILQSLSYGI